MLETHAWSAPQCQSMRPPRCVCQWMKWCNAGHVTQITNSYTIVMIDDATVRSTTSSPSSESTGQNRPCRTSHVATEHLLPARLLRGNLRQDQPERSLCPCQTGNRPATERLLLTCPLHSNLRHNQQGHCPHQTHSTVTYYLLPTCPLHGNLRHRSATTLAPVRPTARQKNICCRRARYTATFCINRPKRYHC